MNIKSFFSKSAALICAAAVSAAVFSFSTISSEADAAGSSEESSTAEIEYVYNNLKYKKSDDHIEISGCLSGVGTKAEVPSEIEGLPVTVIGDMAFNQLRAIEEIVLPDSITYIGTGAFNNLLSLKKVNIPDGVSYIGDECFNYCSSLESITLPESLSYSEDEPIGDKIFYGCSSLKKITILNAHIYLVFSESLFPSDAVIYGYSESSAKMYADKYNREFVAIDEKTSDDKIPDETESSSSEQFEPGDANKDGKLDSKDATAILVDYAGSLLGKKSTLDIKAADINKDNKVDSKDATAVLVKYAESILKK